MATRVFFCSLIKDLVEKGILSPAENNLRSDYPDTDESHVTIEWDVPSDQQEGTYRYGKF